ncbi:uncharacterized protein LOC144907499 [Branchiostoma floridae x Branchiostoma belcheri]
MLPSVSFLVLLIVCAVPNGVQPQDYLLQNLQGSIIKLDNFFMGLESQSKSFEEAFTRLKVIDGAISMQHITIKNVRGGLDDMNLQLTAMGETFGNVNGSMNRDKDTLERMGRYVEEESQERGEEISSFDGIMEEYLADIDYVIDEQKEAHSQSLRQEAERQARGRDNFRQQLQEYQSAREEKQAEIEELMQIVNTQVAALRSKDEALDARVAALQARVQSLIEEVAGLGEQLSGQRLQLETQEATLNGEHLTNVRNSYETHVQRHGQIQQLLETIQATVTALHTRKRQLQNQTTNINAQIQDQQSRLDNHDQQQHSIVQQVEDLGNTHEQQSNAKILRLDDVEATLENLATDTGIVDSVTQMQYTVQDIQANITVLYSKVEQNENLTQDIIQPQLRNVTTSFFQGTNNSLQEYMQTLETFDEHIQSYNETYQDQVSTEEARIQTIETQMNVDSELITALRNTIDSLTTNVEGAEEQFSQYTNSSAISEGLASVEQSIEDVENSQRPITAVQQELTDSRSATDQRFGELEASIQDKERALQQAQSDLQAAAQSIETASVVSDSIASINARVSSNTQGCDDLSSSVEEIDLEYRPDVQAQHTALEQQIAAVPYDEVQRAVAAGFQGDIQDMDNKLNNMEGSVDALEAMAMAFGTSSESTFESLQVDLDTITTQLSNHQSAIYTLQRGQTDGLSGTVTTLQQTVTSLTTRFSGFNTDLSTIERLIQQATSANSVNHYEKGTWTLPEMRNFWGTSQIYGSRQFQTINFNNRFSSTPVVFAAIAKIDLGAGDRHCTMLRVYDVYTYRFSLEYGPCNTSHFYAGKVEWIAVGRR